MYLLVLIFLPKLGHFILSTIQTQIKNDLDSLSTVDTS